MQYHEKAKGRYQTEDQNYDHATTMHTNADVTSILGADEMMNMRDKNGSAAANETTMVQDHDLQKLIGQFRDQSPGAPAGVNASATGMVRPGDVSNCYNPVDISGTN